MTQSNPFNMYTKMTSFNITFKTLVSLVLNWKEKKKLSGQSSYEILPSHSKKISPEKKQAPSSGLYIH